MSNRGLWRGRDKYRKNAIAHMWRRDVYNKKRLISDCGNAKSFDDDVVADNKTRLCMHCERLQGQRV